MPKGNTKKTGRLLHGPGSGKKTIRAGALKPGDTLLLGERNDRPTIVRTIARGQKGTLDHNRLAVGCAGSGASVTSQTYHNHVNSEVVVEVPGA